MIKRQLRPKYTIEQYPVVFTFPGDVLGTPTIYVEVVSGVDPTVSSFAGFPFTFGPLVSVVIVGGLPGVIYKISCEALVGDELLVQVGLIAVLPTTASVPEGTSPLPLTSTQTTPPYSALVIDSLNVASIARLGQIFNDLLDLLDVDSYALDGSLRELIVYYSYGPEEIDVVSYALPGTLRILKVFYSMLPEEIDVTSYALNGTLKVILIQYFNYAPEEIDVTSYALNGTLI